MMKKAAQSVSRIGFFPVVVAAAVLIGVNPAAGAQTAHAFAFETPAGEALPLKRWKGEVLLVAAGDPFCGFTNQYPGLETLWQRYRDDGLTVLGLPLSDVLQRQSMDSQEFARYCRDSVGITYPLAAAVRGAGENAHPFFDWIRDRAGPEAGPEIGFYKYLIGPEGALIAWFPPTMRPEDPALRNAIEAALEIEETAG